MECARTYLCIGKSGGGKSYFAERYCVNFAPSKVVLLNSRKARGDFGGLEVLELSWEDVPLRGEKRVCYVVEDVVSVSGEAKKAIYELLNIESRASDSPVILVTHSLYGTGLFATLNYVNNVVLTSDRVNRIALKQLLGKFLYEEPEKVEAKFAALQRRQYLLLKPSEMTSHIVDADLAEAEEPPVEAAGGVAAGAAKSDLLTHFPASARPLVEYLFNNLPPGSIRQPELTLHCRTMSGGVMRVSFLDYVHNLRDKEAKPDRETRQLHRLVCRTLCFPTSLVENRRLLEISRQEKDGWRRRSEQRAAAARNEASVNNNNNKKEEAPRKKN